MPKIKIEIRCKQKACGDCYFSLLDCGWGCDAFDENRDWNKKENDFSRLQACRDAEVKE